MERRDSAISDAIAQHIEHDQIKERKNQQKKQIQEESLKAATELKQLK